MVQLTIELIMNQTMKTNHIIYTFSIHPTNLNELFSRASHSTIKFMNQTALPFENITFAVD
ncbi:hypothetical protein DWW47_18625 [Odoribacter splanchnicus]|jgi:hypothetical protein|nr:hypothetical protein DWW47_18625 [Odoribacter splanchnicus]HCD93288.1 hypothetical protein [Odoribacter splanchnicus]